jgi:RNA polymerase sigma factor (sigma-70 family)
MIANDALRTVLRSAAGNDQRAWERLFAEFTPTIRGVARRHGLASCDQDDVVQWTWIALFRHIDQVREPSSVGTWLVTTARRQSLRIISQAAREIPSENLESQEVPIVDGDYLPLDERRREAVRVAAASIPPRQRALIAALLVEPALSYKHVSEKLGIPVGAIGPTRQRALTRMRKDPRVSQLLDEYALPHHPTRPVHPEIEVI